MGYYIDLSKISLDEFKKKLESTDLLPSEQILKENIDKNFEALKAQNIENMHQLQQVLKTKAKVNSFAKATSLQVKYLTVLRRKVNSYHPQARKIKDFPSLSDEIKKNLEKTGIKTTLQLYDKIATKKERNQLKNELSINDEEALLLAKLTDVCRLKYVNPAFATLLTDSSYDNVEKIKNADYNELYDELVKLNEEKGYYKGRIGLNDMKFLVNDTVNVSLDIEY